MIELTGIRAVALALACTTAGIACWWSTRATASRAARLLAAPLAAGAIVIVGVVAGVRVAAASAAAGAALAAWSTTSLGRWRGAAGLALTIPSLVLAPPVGVCTLALIAASAGSSSLTRASSLVLALATPPYDAADLLSRAVLIGTAIGVSHFAGSVLSSGALQEGAQRALIVTAALVPGLALGTATVVIAPQTLREGALLAIAGVIGIVCSLAVLGWSVLAATRSPSRALYLLSLPGTLLAALLLGPTAAWTAAVPGVAIAATGLSIVLRRLPHWAG